MNPDEAVGLGVDSSSTTWSRRAEAAIRALRDVESASVQLAGDEICEIHVLTRSSRPPKHIVRDVQTVLLAGLNRRIDHRVVSVAYLSNTHAAPPATNSAPAPSPPPPVTTDPPSAAPAVAETRVRRES